MAFLPNPHLSLLNIEEVVDLLLPEEQSVLRGVQLVDPDEVVVISVPMEVNLKLLEQHILLLQLDGITLVHVDYKLCLDGVSGEEVLCKELVDFLVAFAVGVVLLLALQEINGEGLAQILV